MSNENEAPERIWAKVRTFSRFYGVKTETEVRREWCENYATPEIARKCGAVEYTRADLSDAKDKRIAELEAKLDRVLREYYDVDLADAEPQSLTDAILEARATLAALKGQTNDQ